MRRPARRTLVHINEWVVRSPVSLSGHVSSTFTRSIWVELTNISNVDVLCKHSDCPDHSAWQYIRSISFISFKYLSRLIKANWSKGSWSWFLAKDLQTHIYIYSQIIWEYTYSQMISVLHRIFYYSKCLNGRRWPWRNGSACKHKRGGGFVRARTFHSAHLTWASPPGRSSAARHRGLDSGRKRLWCRCNLPLLCSAAPEPWRKREKERRGTERGKDFCRPATSITLFTSLKC